MEDNNTSEDKYDFEAEDLFGTGGSSEDASEEKRAENLHSKVADIQIFNAFPHTKTDKLDLIKLPRFFTQSYTNFDPKTYYGENESNYCKGVRFATASSIRWRYNKRKREDGENEIIEKETNTKLVKWSDGSKTLHIGKESYSLNSYELGRPRYIAIAHKETKALEFRSKISSHYYSFTPNNLHGLTHKRWIKQMKTRYIDFSTIERLTKEYKEQQKKKTKSSKII